jgi:hypothetical protein
MKWQIGEHSLKIVPADNGLRLEVGLFVRLYDGVFALLKHPIEPRIHDDEAGMSRLSWRIYVEEVVAERGFFMGPKESNSSVLYDTMVRGK